MGVKSKSTNSTDIHPFLLQYISGYLWILSNFPIIADFQLIRTSQSLPQAVRIVFSCQLTPHLSRRDSKIPFSADGVIISLHNAFENKQGSSENLEPRPLENHLQNKKETCGKTTPSIDSPGDDTGARPALFITLMVAAQAAPANSMPSC